jgi:hypothetical protein
VILSGANLTWFSHTGRFCGPFFLDIEMTDSILTHLTKQAEERGADLSALRALAKLKDVEQ